SRHLHSRLSSAAGIRARRIAQAAGEDPGAARERDAAGARGETGAGARAMDAAALIQALTERFPDAVRSSHAYRGDATIVVSREALLDLARALKGDAAFQMNFLMDLTAVDFSTFGKKPSSAFLWRRTTRRSIRRRLSGRARTGSSAKCGTCSASDSEDTRT